MADYDFIILGGGASGFAAAIAADRLGARTAMVNAGLPLGGTCVNVGCVPSKRMLFAAEALEAAAAPRMPGIAVRGAHADFARVVRDQRRLVARLRAEKYEALLEKLRSVTVHRGFARFTGPRSVAVGDRRLTAHKILIATGAAPRVPPIAGLAATGWVTHGEALALESLPRRLAIVGAGPVAVEFAQLFVRFGTQVTVVRRRPGILAAADAELAGRLEGLLTEEGVRFLSCEAFLSAERRGAEKTLWVRCEGRRLPIGADEIMLAAGRAPNTGRLDLAAAGVATAPGGAVAVDRFLRTANPDVYAAGDVADLPRRLETTAGREGTLAAENALAGSRQQIDYDSVPFTVFTDPQLAGVGLTEDAQRRAAGAAHSRSVPLDALPRAVIEGRGGGMVKLVAEPDTGRVVGAHVLAPQAGEVIAAAMFVLRNRNTLEEVAAALPMFPTWAEGLRLAALAFTTDTAGLTCCV